MNLQPYSRMQGFSPDGPVAPARQRGGIGSDGTPVKMGAFPPLDQELVGGANTLEKKLELEG